ncbi:MAG: hypothetical protein IJ943_07805 [Akkermansia sp.]|nr:hypothetical protein [Akkermansia sp.]
MKARYALLAAATLLTPAFAGTPAVEVTEAPAPTKRLSGLVSFGYDSNYTGRGYVVSHSVAQGDSVLNTALKLNYDLGKPGQWTLGSTIAYIIPTSGHTLYGNPTIGPNIAAGAVDQLITAAGGDQLLADVKANPNNPHLALGGKSYNDMVNAAKKRNVKQANIENQFTLITEAKYTSVTEKWNVAFGHNFTHGGLLGVMAKHYRNQGASCVNEFFVTPEWTPYKWLSIGMKTSYSFQGIQGWWFEPYLTMKAPIIGTPEDLKLLGVLTFGMSATANYFQEDYGACGNGSQAFWIKFSTPWFVRDNFIITPSISFNWLGKGGTNANKNSEFRYYTENPNSVPFRNFGVVAGVSATYTF